MDDLPLYLPHALTILVILMCIHYAMWIIASIVLAISMILVNIASAMRYG